MASFILYTRVSTKKQSLGIEAQRETAGKYVAGVDGKIIAEYSEKESGKNDERPELAAAIEACKASHAVLLVAKLDRLSRNVAFLFELRDMLTAAKVEIIVADMPGVIGDTMRLGIFATMAQAERELISQRTKAALAVKKAQGVKLGRKKGADTSKARAAAAEMKRAGAEAWAKNVLPMIKLCRNNGAGLEKTAKALNEAGIATRRGGIWTATAVKRVLAMAE